MELSESIVHEYSILYSTRILQKDKKWSDGILKFYEFNYKLEILNDAQNLIATDFYPQNKKNPITSNFFHSGKEFTLPSNRLVIEIDDYITTYKRDVSKHFKRSNRTDADSTISTNIPNPIHSPSTIPQKKISIMPVATTSSKPSAVNNVLRRPRLGLAKNSATPRITNGSVNKVKKPPLQNIQNRSTITSDIAKNDNDRYFKKDIDSILLYKPKSLPRVLPHTSKNFAWLRPLNGESSSNNSSTVGTSEVQPNKDHINSQRIKVKHEADSVTSDAIKSQGKSVDDADVIYDLSDFEDDEEFFEMLNQIRNEEKAQYRDVE